MPMSSNTGSHELHVLQSFTSFIHCAKIFETTYTSESDFQEAVNSNPLIQVSSLNGLPAWIETEELFNTPAQAAVPARGQGQRYVAAIPAVPAVPGPQALAFLHKVSWLQLITEGERMLPGRGSVVLSRLMTLLVDKGLDAVRRDESSEVHAMAKTLSTYTASWASLGGDASVAQLARQVGPYLASAIASIPEELVGSCGSVAACEAEMRDSHTLLRGRESEAASVYWAKIHKGLSRFSTLKYFDGHMVSQGVSRCYQSSYGEIVDGLHHSCKQPILTSHGP